MENNNKQEKASLASVFGCIVFIGIGIALFVGLLSFTKVGYGSVSVVTRFGKATDKIIYPGLNWKVPFVEGTIRYSTQKVTYETSNNPDQSKADYTDWPVDTTTQDGQQVKIRYTVRFSVDANKVQWIANNIGNEKAIVEKIIKTDSRIYVRNIPREFTAEQLYTGNIAEVQQEIFDVLEPRFAKNGIILDDFGIRQIEFQQEYIDAIEAKQIAKENVVTAQYKAEEEENKKQQAITKAEGEAEAQRLQQQTLTPLLVQKMYVEKWNGQLPTYMCDEGNFLLSMSQ